MDYPTKEQPVTCSVCGTVVQRRCFKRHLESHSNIKSHVCRICGKFYTRKDSLQRHVMSVHKLYDSGEVSMAKNEPMNKNDTATYNQSWK
jgi:uncharacterized Zn-finger protein